MGLSAASANREKNAFSPSAALGSPGSLCFMSEWLQWTVSTATLIPSLQLSRPHHFLSLPRSHL